MKTSKINLILIKIIIMKAISWNRITIIVLSISLIFKDLSFLHHTDIGNAGNILCIVCWSLIIIIAIIGLIADNN